MGTTRSGGGGFIVADGSNFIHSKTKGPIRFWAVNGPATSDASRLAGKARLLAKRGVNLVRIHHGYFDENGEPDLKAVGSAKEIRLEPGTLYYLITP